MSNLIKLKNVNKSFDGIKKIKVLKKLSFNFKKGKVYSIVGPSGSGKSTLLNLLSLIDRPNSGIISLENKTIFKFAPGCLFMTFWRVISARSEHISEEIISHEKKSIFVLFSHFSQKNMCCLKRQSCPHWDVPQNKTLIF